MSNARKLFRVLKSLIEYKKINDLLAKAEQTPLHKLVLKLIPRIAFFFFWILDTLVVLYKIKVYQGIDIKSVSRKWAMLWNIANFTTAID